MRQETAGQAKTEMMTETQETLLDILAACLFGAPKPELRKADWAQLFDEAQRQAVFPLVFAAVEEEAEKALSAEQFQEYQNQFFHYNAETAKNAYYHGELHELLAGNGIPYVIIKGQASARYYPDPSLRASGDVDCLVAAEDLDRAGKVLEEAGFRKLPDPEHECHVVFQRDDETVEMHWEPNGIPEGEKGDLCRACLKDCITRAQIVSGDETYFVPDAFHHGLILLLHTARHLINTGIGLRHLCDWAVFAQYFEDDAFVELFREKLSAVGLWRFAQMLTAVSVRYLGLPEQAWAKDAAEPTFLEAMMNDILASGNFGNKDPERINDAKMISAGGRMKGNMLAQLFSSLSKKAKAAMPICEQIPLLLPIGWVYVGFRHLATVRKGNRPQIHVRKMVRGAAVRREIYREFRLFE